MGNGAKFCGIWHIFLTKKARNFFLNGKKLVGKMQQDIKFLFFSYFLYFSINIVLNQKSIHFLTKKIKLFFDKVKILCIIYALKISKSKQK